MAKLSKAAIDKALRSSVARVLWDDELKGFGCRLSASGRATWIVKRRLGEGGRKAKHVLASFGTYPMLEPDEARKKARALLQEISTGIDLGLRKRQSRIEHHEQYKNGKLEDVWNLWLERNRDDKGKERPPGRSYWDGIERLGKVEVMPSLGASTPVAAITKQDLRNLIDKIEQRSQSVGRMTYAALSPFLKWCLSREIISVNPLDGLESPSAVDSRDRVLTDDELLKVWEASDHIPYPWGPLYKLLILTLQRRDEVAGIQWAEIYTDKKEWIIPAFRTKNGKEHLVHLSPLAAGIVEDLARKAPRILEGRFAYPFVFTTTGETYVSGFSKAKATLDETIEEIFGEPLAPWRLHDLRRTGATGMAKLKVQPHIVERVLNHMSGGASAKLGGMDVALMRIYQRFEYADERQEAINRWSNHLAVLIANAKAKQAKADNVTILRA